MSTTTKLAMFCGAMLMASVTMASPQKTPDQLANDLVAVQTASGAPVPQFSKISMGTTKWEPIDNEHLLVYTRHATAYLLDLDAHCEGLINAQGVSVGGLSRTVYSGTDTVHVTGPSNPGGISCRIVEIRPVDTAKLKSLRTASK